MTKRHTKEVRPHPVERSPQTQAPSSKPDQNEQNSKLSDGPYFWLDGYASVSPLSRRCLQFFPNYDPPGGKGRAVAAGASLWTWGVLPFGRWACSCSSALARLAWIFGQSIPGSSETAAGRRFGGSARRTLARSRWTRTHHPRRCASASAGITPILGIASSPSFQIGTALKGQRLSARWGLGGW